MRKTSRGMTICAPDRKFDQPEAYSTTPDETKKLLRFWIEWTFEPARRIMEGRTSYGLKHDFEYDTGIYITNGEFKGAMAEAGFVPVESEALNWEFSTRLTQRAKRWKAEHEGKATDRREWISRYYNAPARVEEINGPCIYFLQAGEAGFIKIGTAIDLNKRIPQLQTGCPQELRLLGVMKGNTEIESDLHRQFIRHRFRGEWFRPAPEIIDFIFKNAAIYGFREKLQAPLREAATLEERILPLLAEAAKQKNTNGYNRIGTYYHLKKQLVHLVGWDAIDPTLRTQQHYDAVILFMSDLLPSDNTDLSGEDNE